MSRIRQGVSRRIFRNSISNFRETEIPRSAASRGRMGFRVFAGGPRGKSFGGEDGEYRRQGQTQTVIAGFPAG